MNDPLGKLAQIAKRNNEFGAKDIYDSWASEYDHSLKEDYGYIAPEITVNLFKNYFSNKNIQIMDAGCGTGLVGAILLKKGYHSVDGIDISPEMIKVAKNKQIYRALFEFDLNKSHFKPKCTYDALISVGSFGHGALKPTAINNLLNLISSGGMLFIFMNSEPFKSDNYIEHFNSLSDQKLWITKSISNHNYMNKLDRPGKLIVAVKSQ